MSSTIEAARDAVGWSQRELASRLGVNVSTVSRMEESERRGTIRLDTLRRALAAMDREPRLEVVPVRREERVLIELHRALAAELLQRPEAALAVVPRNLDRIRPHARGEAVHWLDRWEELAAGPVDELIDAMLADTTEGRELRQNSPFAGALTDAARVAAIQRASAA